jgi:hypothetical protein
MIEFKIRSSALGSIMTEPKSKSDMFSKTAVATAIQSAVVMKYGKHPKDLQADAIRKGLQVEEDAITWLSVRDRKVYVKNEERLENEWISGTPDIIDGEVVIDIKSSWDIFTFYASMFDNLDKGYWWQLQAYMALTGCKNARLVYVLCDTPEAILGQMARKIEWELGSPATDAVSGPIIETMYRNHRYPELSEMDRIFEFGVERDDEAMGRAYERVEQLRKHIQGKI